MTTDSNITARPNKQAEPPKSILKSAVFMSLGTFLSRLLGVIRVMALSAYFPTYVTDAHVVAFRLPNLFRRLLGEGSLASSFIPVYVDALKHDQEMESKGQVSTLATQLSNAIYSILSIITLVLSVIAIIYMPNIVNLIVSGEEYQKMAGKVEVTIQMARIMFGFIYLITSYAFFMSILNVNKKFFLPAAAQGIFNVVVILASFVPEFGFPGERLAWAVILGGAMMVFLCGLQLRKLNRVPNWTLRWNVPGISLFFRNFLPGLLGASVAQVMTILNTNFTSRLPEGSHSYIYYADLLLEFPLSLLSVSLGVALLPTLSEFWTHGKRDEMVKFQNRHINFLLFLSLPASVGLYSMGAPIVDVLFGHGKFTQEGVHWTAQILKIYAFTLIGTGMTRVTLPAFYAAKDTRSPAIVALICLIVHYFLADWASIHYGLTGLMWATTLGTFLNLTLLFILFKFKFGKIGIPDMVLLFLRQAPAMIAMFYSGPFVFKLFLPLSGKYIALAFGIGTSALLYFSINYLVKHPEMKNFESMLRRRLKKV